MVRPGPTVTSAAGPKSAGCPCAAIPLGVALLVLSAGLGGRGGRHLRERRRQGRRLRDRRDHPRRRQSEYPLDLSSHQRVHRRNGHRQQPPPALDHQVPEHFRRRSQPDPRGLVHPQCHPVPGPPGRRRREHGLSERLSAHRGLDRGRRDLERAERRGALVQRRGRWARLTHRRPGGVLPLHRRRHREHGRDGFRSGVVQR